MHGPERTMALESQIYGETFPPGLPPLRFLLCRRNSSQRSIIIGALPANMLERASTSDHARYRNNACVIPQTFIISVAESSNEEVRSFGERVPD